MSITLFECKRLALQTVDHLVAVDPWPALTLSFKDKRSLSAGAACPITRGAMDRAVCLCACSALARGYSGRLEYLLRVGMNRHLFSLSTLDPANSRLYHGGLMRLKRGKQGQLTAFSFRFVFSRRPPLPGSFLRLVLPAVRGLVS